MRFLGARNLVCLCFLSSVCYHHAFFLLERQVISAASKGLLAKQRSKLVKPFLVPFWKAGGWFSWHHYWLPEGMPFVLFQWKAVNASSRPHPLHALRGWLDLHSGPHRNSWCRRKEAEKGTRPRVKKYGCCYQQMFSLTECELRGVCDLSCMLCLEDLGFFFTIWKAFQPCSQCPGCY